MKFRFAALAATFLASTASFAGVVTGSSNIDFLAIDGQKTFLCSRLCARCWVSLFYVEASDEDRRNRLCA